MYKQKHRQGKEHVLKDTFETIILFLNTNIKLKYA